ncbi:hypothetical protein [Hymenobacter sp. BT491]|uniref:hypothetical protein n=1 Tax=Hymenobacter sp. BT491 TaxID=2766779 RepID=UPI001653B14C|nr:hypothetical protein [Hymenobacter sp. BT491]MBC6988764.1 hypothetical protein [Hymenobacter sp. BT491]
MNDLRGIDRRSFLEYVCALTATLAVTGPGGLAKAAARPLAEDAPNTHNMLVFGEQAIYVSHLPMFDSVAASRTEYTSPHRYQVILEVAFQKAGQDLQKLYRDDRLRNANVRIYTLNPAEFVLSRLAPAGAGSPLLSDFQARVFRGHLERGGKVIPGLDDVQVRVKRVVHFRKFDPQASKLAEMKYLLFGSTQEAFVAHYISKPPDFDHVLSVKLDGHGLTDAQLRKGLEITIPGKANQAGERLKEAQQVAALVQMPGNQTAKLGFKVGRQIYFEEGELLMPPTFADTKLEQLGN